MDDEQANAYVHALARDWHTAPLSEVDRALCLFAAKLTLTPAEMSPADLDALRAVGLDDTAIHDATQVIAYFNYINRVADALGVEPEDFIQPWGQ
ncbi:MAG: peroxidase [Anaerolineales bacterium]|nr:peroxidase [Anaerolineales bacterium]